MGVVVEFDEESIFSAVVSSQGRRSSNASGLVLGHTMRSPKHTNCTHHLLLAVLPTPTQHNNEQDNHHTDTTAASTSPSTSSSASPLDSSWCVEHARQVSRLLAGGVQVLGLALLAPLHMLPLYQSALLQIMHNLHTDGDPILLIKDSATGKLQVSSYPTTTTTTTAPQVVQHKAVESLPRYLTLNWHSFTGWWNLDITCPRTRLHNSSWSHHVEGTVLSLTQQVKACLYTVDGNFDQSQKESKLVGTLKNQQAPHQVVFFNSLHSCPQTTVGVEGLVRLTGWVEGRAYAHSKERLCDAVQALRDDVIASIKTRIELLSEEMDRNEEDTGEQNPLASNPLPTEPSVWILPKRAFFPFAQHLNCCDYLFPSETLQDGWERCNAMFSAHRPEERQLTDWFQIEESFLRSDEIDTPKIKTGNSREELECKEIEVAHAKQIVPFGLPVHVFFIGILVILLSFLISQLTY